MCPAVQLEPGPHECCTNPESPAPLSANRAESPPHPPPPAPTSVPSLPPVLGLCMRSPGPPAGRSQGPRPLPEPLCSLSSTSSLLPSFSAQQTYALRPTNTRPPRDTLSRVGMCLPAAPSLCAQTKQASDPTLGTWGAGCPPHSTLFPCGALHLVPTLKMFVEVPNPAIPVHSPAVALGACDRLATSGIQGSGDWIIGGPSATAGAGPRRRMAPSALKSATPQENSASHACWWPAIAGSFLGSLPTHPPSIIFHQPKFLELGVQTLAAPPPPAHTHQPSCQPHLPAFHGQAPVNPGLLARILCRQLLRQFPSPGGLPSLLH